MSDSNVVMECQDYGDTVPEVEVVETSFMCGECFLLFPTTEEFNAHNCQESQVGGVQSIVEQDVSCQEPVTGHLDVPESNPCVWEAQESEAAMEEAVANILGEKMKKMAPQRQSGSRVEFEHTLNMGEEPSIEHKGIMDQQMESVVEHTVENKDFVEIPSSNIYMYDNPIYLNRLMKDNTFGRRVRHDAPYRLRLGPWDNKSSRLLINLVKEYPKAYFILDKECKRTEAWEMIRNKMSEAGYQFTVLQIRMRWRELVKTYRTTINYNDMHNVRRYCQYFEELTDLFGVWDYTATEMLIRQMELHGSKRLGQNGGTRMRFKIWNHIRLLLEAQGYNFTADQVQGRWSTLVNLYQRMVENNSKPYTEKITMAYREHMERVFNYVPERNSKWRKIMEKRGKTPRTVKRNWTHPVERKMLFLYRDRIYRFNNEHIDKLELWEEIVLHLKEEAHYFTTVEKVRSRFSELTKQFTTVEQHNSQSGTIRRECKHHELLSEIYNVYNYWPHDKSTISLNKSNSLRMRQVNAQLAWSESQSRAVLQLYPQILVSHISSGDHQPIEEFWLQLAKAYLNTQGDRKQCYEIEEHIALLRRGYHSRNPFPFCNEMQLLEETEVTLGFSPDPVVAEDDQFVPYWSHDAAILLLDLVISYRQDGGKYAGLFELISRDMGSHGYRYTGEECRVYYFLLRQLYTNRLRTLKRNKELLKPFPYMDKMSQVDAVVSLPRFVETKGSCQVILTAALCVIQPFAGESEEEKFTYLLSLLTNTRLYIRQKSMLHPLPSVKKVGQILKEAINDRQNNQPEIVKLRTILEPVSKVLTLASERSLSDASLKALIDGKCEKDDKSLHHQPKRMAPDAALKVFHDDKVDCDVKKTSQPKYGRIQWTKSTYTIMLKILQEWRLLCHDTSEFEGLFVAGSPVWKDVASRLKFSYKISPAKCQERFSMLCREYKSVVAFNARLGPGEPAKTVTCQELLQSVLAPLVFYEAEFDPRDDCGVMEDVGGWGPCETVELLFTVRELGSHIQAVDWENVSLFLNASGYRVDAESCKKRFEALFKDYESAERHNQSCGVKNRKRSPFYFKIRSLFVNHEISDFDPDPADKNAVIDEMELQKVLVQILKVIKKSFCHSVPRRSLLMSIARLLDEHFQYPTPTFTTHQVWQSMVKLHLLHRESFEVNKMVDYERDLGEVWQNHPSPLVAYNLLALPVSHWKLTSEWSVEEVYLLIDNVINWELQPRSLQNPEKSVFQSASEDLLNQGYCKSPEHCYELWQYLATTYNHGGYRNFAEQLCILHLINPSLLQTKPSSLQVKIHSISCLSNYESQTSIAKQTKTLKRPPEDMGSILECIPKSPIKKLKVCAKANAPGNVVSYVRINVPKQKRSIQVSTDELNYDKKSKKNCSINASNRKVKKMMRDSDKILSGHSLTVKLESELSCSQGKRNDILDEESIKNENILDEVIIKSEDILERKGNSLVRDTFDNLVPRTSEPSSEYYFKCSPDSQEEKMKVDITKVIVNEKSKVIECRTTGVSPRTIMLHYPSDYAIPTDMLQVYVSRSLVYPELLESANLSNEVIKLLKIYQEQVYKEQQNLIKVLQDSHINQVTVLKNIFNTFQEIYNSLDA